jgi:hypothetical protein
MPLFLQQYAVVLLKGKGHISVCADEDTGSQNEWVGLIENYP